MREQPPSRCRFCTNCRSATPGRHPHSAPRGDLGGSQPSDVCEIRLWRGYANSEFYALAVTPGGLEYVAARSPMFWSFRNQIPNEKLALAAHTALVEHLARDGWRPATGVDEQDSAQQPWCWTLRFGRTLGADLAEAVRTALPAGVGVG